MKALSSAQQLHLMFLVYFSFQSSPDYSFLLISSLPSAEVIAVLIRSCNLIFRVSSAEKVFAKVAPILLMTFRAAVISYAVDQRHRQKSRFPLTPLLTPIYLLRALQFQIRGSNVIPLASLPLFVCSGEHKTTHCPVSSAKLARGKSEVECVGQCKMFHLERLWPPFTGFPRHLQGKQFCQGGVVWWKF